MKALFLDADAVFFDFDGVIADSHGVKTSAFAALYAEDHPDIVDDVVAYHNANGGLSRYKKFEYYERALLGRELTAERSDLLGRRFAKAVVDAVVASPEVPGVGALLDALHARTKPCHIASGTPEEELREIVARRGLSDYFCAVRGSPAEKAEILTQVSTERGHRMAHCVMVGDAMSDYLAAKAVGMPFVGVVQQRLRSPFPHDAAKLADFWALAESIR